jgi:chloride channel protein, CIC family
VEALGGTTDPVSVMRSRRFLGLLVIVAIVGVVASAAAWGFQQLIYQIQQGVFTDLPGTLGFDDVPVWWPLPWLMLAGVAVALAIVRLPGTGGHVPAHGLDATPTQPIELPGVLLAAVAGIGLAIVLGPEAPLIALGGGLGFFLIRTIRADTPPEAQLLVATSGVFAAISFLFGSPVIAAVFLVEASGLGGPRMPLVLIPGLFSAGIGSLVSTGMGSWTGLSTDNIALSPVSLPDYARPDVVDFLWTVPLAAAVALGIFLIFRLGRQVARFAPIRPFLILPVIGLLVAGLAIGFDQATDKGTEQVLFSGQEQVTPLVDKAGAWSLGALALLVLCKGLAYGLALGSFRGGPVFPALFLGAAAGLMAAKLPGFDMTPAVAVGIASGIVAGLRLPLSAVVLTTLLIFQSGFGVTPLIILGVVVAYLITLALPDLGGGSEPEADGGRPGPGETPASAPT